MKQVVIQVNGLKMVNFDSGTYVAKMKLSYVVDGKASETLLNLDLKNKSEGIVAGLIGFVKRQANQNVDERDDILDQLYIKKLIDEERIEEKLSHYFIKLCEKVKFMKSNKNHVDHMKFYQEIKASGISL